MDYADAEFPHLKPLPTLELQKGYLLGIYISGKVFINVIYSRTAFSKLWV